MRVWRNNLVCHVRRDLEVRRRNLCRRNTHVITQTDEHAGDGASLLVGRLEEPSRHDSATVNDERPRKGITELRVGWIDGRVKDAKALDNSRPVIGQQRECACRATKNVIFFDYPGAIPLSQGKSGV